MKSLIRMFMVLILSVIPVFANAAGPVITGDLTINSLAAAKKLTAGISGYRINGGHYVADEGRYHWMSFSMDRRGLIYEMDINEVRILEPGETLPGVPFPEKGSMEDFHLNVEMLDAEGVAIGYGWFYREHFIAGDPISITIGLYSDAKVLDVPGAEGYTIFIDGQYAGSWASNYGAFIIWVDETRSLDPSHLYQVRDRDGNLVGAGQLNVNYEIERVGQPAYSTIGFQVSGTTYIDRWTELGEGNFSIDERIADLRLPAADAKTFVVDAVEGSRFFAFGDFTEFVVYVNRDGTIHEVGRQTPNLEGYWASYQLPAERVIVLVHGSAGSQFQAFASFPVNW